MTLSANYPPSAYGCNGRSDRNIGFWTELKERAQVHSTDWLLQRLGYACDNQKAALRLQQVIESPRYGLDESHYDFRYSSTEFFRAVCQVLGMDPEQVTAEISDVQAELNEARVAWRPFIWVDTHFRRENQPVFILGLCESSRYLRLHWTLARKPISEQLEIVRGRIAEHWQATSGQLGVWGQIQEYWYYYQEDTAYRLTPTGELIKHHHGSVRNRASATLRGRPLPTVCNIE